jgi:2-methylcitrate dehydratase PrpD
VIVYRAAVADLAAALAGSNVEAARAALRGLIGPVPVFAKEGKLYGRDGFDSAQLVRKSNRTLLNRLVARA